MYITGGSLRVQIFTLILSLFLKVDYQECQAIHKVILTCDSKYSSINIYNQTKSIVTKTNKLFKHAFTKVLYHSMH